MKIVICNLKGHQIGLSFPYERLININDTDNLVLKKNEKIKNPYDDDHIFIIKKIELLDHFITLNCKKRKIKNI